VGNEFFIDNLLVRIHFIIGMIRWTGLAPWEFEFPFPGSLTSTFLGVGRRYRAGVEGARGIVPGDFVDAVVPVHLQTVLGVKTFVLKMAQTQARIWRGATRAEDAEGTPTQSRISPSKLVYEDICADRWNRPPKFFPRTCPTTRGEKMGKFTCCFENATFQATTLY